MKSIRSLGIWVLLAALLLSGCGNIEAVDGEQRRIKIGMILDYGLGDQAFNDTAFLGLIKARDELNVLFDYRDLLSSKSYEQGLTELIEDEQSDLVIGLGNNMIPDFITVAKAYPEQQFLFIDHQIDLPNVASITFREDEGSFLAGVIAGLRTDTNSIGFIGGMDIPVINRFRDGFIAGVKQVNSKAIVNVEYADDFGNPEMGRSIAKVLIEDLNADIIYPAAGLTGLGAIEEAASKQKYAIGVDSDQFYVAEETVITSMVKHIDVAVYTAVKEFVEQGSLEEKHIELGIEQNGVGIAPVRIVPLNARELDQVESYREQLISGSISARP
jgi:basic membrane protein A